MRIGILIVSCFFIYSATLLSQDQIDRLSVNVGYTCSFPKIINHEGNLMLQSDHDLLLNLSYQSKLWKSFDYQLGKGLVKYDNNEMFPVNAINSMALEMNGLQRNEIHIDFVLQGTAGVMYNFPLSSKKNKWNVGLLGAYDISLRKETNANGVDFAMKQYFLKFSQAEIFTTIEYRRNRCSINVGYRVFKVRLFDDILDGDKSGAQFVNASKVRITLGYHFRKENLGRGAINFPGVEMD